MHGLKELEETPRTMCELANIHMRFFCLSKFKGIKQDKRPSILPTGEIIVPANQQYFVKSINLNTGRGPRGTKKCTE